MLLNKAKMTLFVISGMNAKFFNKKGVQTCKSTAFKSTILTDQK